MAASSAPQNGSSVLVARSALLSLTAAPTDHALALQVTRVANHRLIAGPGTVAATLDGHAVAVAAQPDGTYILSTRDQSAGAHALGVVVAHDGIRELLTGTVTVPEQQTLFDMIEGHGMSAWWVLNVAVVLIAAIIISRRRR